MASTRDAFIGELLAPAFAGLPPGAAEQLAAYQVDESLLRRAEELADAASEGTLTADERREYEALVSAADTLAAVQAVARRVARCEASR